MLLGEGGDRNNKILKLTNPISLMGTYRKINGTHKRVKKIEIVIIIF